MSRTEERVYQLESENAELKRQLEQVRNHFVKHLKHHLIGLEENMGCSGYERSLMCLGGVIVLEVILESYGGTENA